MKSDIYSFFLECGPWNREHLIKELKLISSTRFCESEMDWDYYVSKYRALFIEEHGYDPIDDFEAGCVCPTSPGHACVRHPRG